VSKGIVEKFFKPKRYQTEQLRAGEESDIIDARMKIDLLTRELILRYRLGNRVQPVLSIPLAYNANRGVFELIETPSIITARAQGYYYGALPGETTPGYYPLAIDANHRLYVVDDQALRMLQSIYNSLGDAGASPANSEGKTVLKWLDYINYYLSGIHSFFESPVNAETYTTTPLGASAAYYGPARDFYYSRLTTMGVMGYADQPSATDGVYIQLSLDATNWDYKGATATLSAAGAVSLAQVVTAKYARAVWVNGATAQTVFRFGGRYMIAGSENPPVSPALQPTPDPICNVCGRDMTETSDFFAENKAVYCPKCYANKRWKELDAKARAAWQKALKAWLKRAQDEELNRAKAHAPDGAEAT